LRLAIAAADGILTVAVSDNGRGLHPDWPRDRNGADGLENMQRRLQQLGGRCELTSRPGQGMTVTFKVPLAGRNN
jgi:signal transduction histidine kinase